jgi:hypothetical protein
MSYKTLRGAIDRPPVIETLFENDVVKIDRITVRGQITPPGVFPDEPSHEFIQVLKGNIVLEYKLAGGETKKVSLRPGEFAIKSPKEQTRADFTPPEEDTIYLKISHGGKPGKYPHFTGAVGKDETHHGGK